MSKMYFYDTDKEKCLAHEYSVFDVIPVAGSKEVFYEIDSVEVTKETFEEVKKHVSPSKF